MRTKSRYRPKGRTEDLHRILSEKNLQLQQVEREIRALRQSIELLNVEQQEKREFFHCQLCKKEGIMQCAFLSQTGLENHQVANHGKIRRGKLAKVQNNRS